MAEEFPVEDRALEFAEELPVDDLPLERVSQEGEGAAVQSSVADDPIPHGHGGLVVSVPAAKELEKFDGMLVWHVRSVEMGAAPTPDSGPHSTTVNPTACSPTPAL
mgnify:CR=1 FL=1